MIEKISVILLYLSFQGAHSFTQTIKTKHADIRRCCTWSPQDLTKNSPGYQTIPEDDYIKKYQRNPDLWPIEFFIIVHRRFAGKTQLLVRKSANGTSKYGVGTGVPVTRWMLSSAQTPTGYALREPLLNFEASGFPEFPKGQEPWTYEKIDIREDAFAEEFKDFELEQYAGRIQRELRNNLANRLKKAPLNSWERSTTLVVKEAVDKTNSVAAIQGTLRMSGLFEYQNDNNQRYVELGENAPDPSKLVQSTRIYTMFPQMPSPMPPPSTSPEDLKQEIATRPERMAKNGRDPHKDQFGRTFTHISTSNVSNTIHGVYFSLDVTNFADLEEVPALDLFGCRKIDREWVSLNDLKVVESDGRTLAAKDTKPTFISGFIVRQLIREGVIGLQ